MATVPSAISVLLADDDEVFCELITLHARDHAGLFILGSTDNAIEAARLAEALSPSVLVLGQLFADERAPGLLGTVRRRSPGTAVVMASSYITHAVIAKALADGAQGYFLKTLPWPEIAALIQRAAGGELALGPLAQCEMERAAASLPPGPAA